MYIHSYRRVGACVSGQTGVTDHLYVHTYVCVCVCVSVLALHTYAEVHKLPPAALGAVLSINSRQELIHVSRGNLPPGRIDFACVRVGYVGTVALTTYRRLGLGGGFSIPPGPATIPPTHTHALHFTYMLCRYTGSPCRNSFSHRRGSIVIGWGARDCSTRRH